MHTQWSTFGCDAESYRLSDQCSEIKAQASEHSTNILLLNIDLIKSKPDWRKG